MGALLRDLIWPILRRYRFSRPRPLSLSCTRPDTAPVLHRTAHSFIRFVLSLCSSSFGRIQRAELGNAVRCRNVYDKCIFRRRSLARSPARCNLFVQNSVAPLHGRTMGGSRQAGAGGLPYCDWRDMSAIDLRNVCSSYAVQCTRFGAPFIRRCRQ